ncbi:MAG: hypothetical protein CM1200mP41_10990 [Gammaproteobacteria bacterium]|nr:MAG: hypothetical protein CM1200mP41_10990 [Gammaproteobacteria bacterium]
MCGRLRHFFYKESPSFKEMVHDDYKIDGRTGVWGASGYATEIITATGGGYQHLFSADSSEEGLKLHKVGGDVGVQRFWSSTCVDRAIYKPEPECAVPTPFPSALVAPTAKFILDQFSPPPMAGSSVPVTVSNDGKTLYVAKFDDGKATGDLEAWSLSAANIPTSIKWGSGSKLDARSRLASNRNALTYSGGRGVKMEWNRLSDDQKNDFLSGRSEESSDQARLKFLLGDRSKEGSEFHTRSSVLGPIARSAPVYVGAPNQTWLTSVGGSTYANFLKKAAKRKAWFMWE